MTFVLIHAFVQNIFSFLPLNSYQISCVFNTAVALVGIWYFLKFLRPKYGTPFFYVMMAGLIVFDETFILSLSSLFPDALMLLFSMSCLYYYDVFHQTKKLKYGILSLVLIILAITCREYAVYFLFYPLLKNHKFIGRKVYVYIGLALATLTIAGILFIPQFAILFEGLFRVFRSGKLHLVLFGVTLNMRRMYEFMFESVLVVYPVIVIMMFSKSFRSHIPFKKILFLTFPCLIFPFIFVNGRTPLRYMMLGHFSLMWIYTYGIEYFYNHPFWTKTNLTSYKKYFVVLAFVPVFTNSIGVYNYSEFLRQGSQEREVYYEHIKNILDDNTVIMPGLLSSMVFHLIENEKKGHMIWSGWNWNSDTYFEDNVTKYLNEGKRVLLDPTLFTEPREVQAVKDGGKKFRYVRFDKYFYEVKIREKKKI
jgi:hypothetical protein